MYKTDDTRRKERQSSYYTSVELDEQCKAYFDDCDAEERAPTLPGLLLWLGVTEKEWNIWMQGTPGSGYSKHPRVCQKALLEMRDRLEQRKDTAAIFLLKQRNYGGYSDRPDPNTAGGIKIHVSFGKTPRKETKQ